MMGVHDTILMKGGAQPFPHGEMIKAKCVDEGKAVHCPDASKAGCLKCSQVFVLNLSLIFSDPTSVSNQVEDAMHSGL